MTRALMFQGTGSNVGKSVLVAGLCRAAANRGLKVVPFKPQNMSNNASVAQIDPNSESVGQGEIGRAQWLQALACRQTPQVDMNPVLLKPQSESGSQIVCQGKVVGKTTAKQYHQWREQLVGAVCESFDRLSTEADLILIEGAGSAAESNLRRHDIANMGFARIYDIPVVLVGDIDRGGVIASLVGSHVLLDAEDRNLVCGYLINKFRGDAGLFQSGIDDIARHTGWSCYGVVPWLDVMRELPEEDSVGLGAYSQPSRKGVQIVVPMLGRIANFDDLDPLRAIEEVSLHLLHAGDELPQNPDLIIIPGTKSTLSDMRRMEELGWADWIRCHADGGGPVIGICGGYQILGREISDPHHIEGDLNKVKGLGLLDIKTELAEQKTVQTTYAQSLEYDVELEGYEIHMGHTVGEDCSRPMININGIGQGAMDASGKVRGCYLHGLFGNARYCENLLASLGAVTQLRNQMEIVDGALDILAEQLVEYVDFDALMRSAKVL